MKSKEKQLPRERLESEGAERLQDHELLAILLRTGYRGVDVLQLAESILNEYSGLQGLLQCSYQQLRSIKGLGIAKASEMAAVLEITKRMAKPKALETLQNSEDAASFLMPLLRHEKQEKFLVLCLNSKNQLLKLSTVFVGTLNSTVVHPREVYQVAIQYASAGILVAHNHPSGDPTPSNEDLKVTQNLIESGRVMGIPLLDHLVIGHGRWHSLRSTGMFERK
ncbi:hypothetical protein SDC9_76336 [bioreactor metagenome]|uniref:MPN domain-containing protein n=1 Tax=bioreactor metagenome TaxID=1076179 RepID=A0A644YMJ1_9ZZZZ